jgi:arylsulfatase A-like enzyme
MTSVSTWLLALCLTIPVDGIANAVQSGDLERDFKNPPLRVKSQPLFFSRPPDRKNYYGFENLPDLAVRSGKWKLLCDYDGGRPELYNVITDPGESSNLAETRAEWAEELTGMVKDWHRSMPSREPGK